LFRADNLGKMATVATATEPIRVQTEEQRAEAARSVIFFLFFISGFAALIYQIVWQRALFAIYGINVQSVTVVVSAFMLGLGLGSLLGGYVSTLSVPLVPVFSAAELGTAVFGFISLRLFNHVAVHTAGANTLATGVLAFVLVLIPTVLMGSTLPVLVTYCVRVIPNMGRWTGSLYCINTLGSAIACTAAATFAMRLLGESGCVEMAACINTIVGATALSYYYLARPRDSALPLDCTPIIEQAELLPFVLGVVVAAASGLIALAYEIIWYRVFSFSIATKSQTFGIVIGRYLLGIAFGALIAERICRNRQDSARQRRTAGLLIVIGNLLAFVVAPIASYCTKALHEPNLAIFFVPVGALLLGTVFPLICHLTIRPDARAGSRMSQLYFSNIIGSTLGSFVVGYVLMDFMSTAQMSILLVACGTLLGLTLMVWKDRSQVKPALALALACVVVIVTVWPSFATMYERLLLSYPAPAKFEYLIENRSGVVAVLPDRTVIGGGVYDGKFNTDPLHDSNGIFRAYALSALHRAPRDVLMVGLSSGSWAQVIANNPYVEHLSIVEINPGYLSLIPRYSEVRSVLSNPKVTIEIDDGRRWLRRYPGRKFDAVVMNTTYHWRASVTNLLSTEFLQLVQQHLKPGGIFYYNTTDSAEAQVTGASVFRYAVRVFNFIAVSDSPIVVDRERWLGTMQEYMIDGRRVLVSPNSPETQVLLDKYSKWAAEAHGSSAAQMIEYGNTLLTRYKGRTIITDDNMACEWRE
jgi:spermidine synthase